MKNIIIYILWCSALVHGQLRKNDARKRINEEARSGVWHSIELPLNYFDVLDNRTYRARYITNDQFYKKGGPIIVYIGGEWEIEDYGIGGGVAFQLARQHNGYLFYPEHRYFGKSLPFPRPVSAENLRYITPDYSLADLAHSLSHIKETVDGLKNSQVVVTGGSYAGALAVWARLKYPHIIDIAYACGGVTKTETFNSAYYDVVYRGLKQINPECVDIVKSGSHEAIRLQKSLEGEAKLKAMFPNVLCPEEKSIYGMAGRIFNSINPQIWPVYKSMQVCHYLVTNTTGSPLERLSQVVPYTSKNGDGHCDMSIYREWFYLVCTFYGNIQLTGQTNFGNIYTPEQKLRKYCSDSFGPTFNQDFVDALTHRTTIFYGGVTPDVSKVLSVQGTHDPWYPNAILDDLNDKTPVVYIEGANHCLEIGEEQDDETPQVSQSKTEILEQLARWIR